MHGRKERPAALATHALAWLLGPAQPAGGAYASTREFFLRGLSACYFAAFASFLVQVPGLYGSQGIAPADDPVGMERRCLGGLALSALGLCGLGNVPVMWGMLSLYDALVKSAPEPFYSFQWDVLLLEVGFMGVILAPLIASTLEPRPSRAALWMLRFILFKLMLMSGVVKLTEGDASWKELTAIWYHFATQCIPTPFAWHFHNLPMWMERLFCATCFVIEIPAAFLILVPLRHVQLLAALLQIALQLVIIITGNYTFFNVLTILLACTLLDHDALPWCVRPTPLVASAPVGTTTAPPGERLDDDASSTDPLLRESEAQPPGAQDHSRTRPDMLPDPVLEKWSRYGGWASLAAAVLCVAYASGQYGLNPELQLRTSNRQVLDMASLWVPRALILMSVAVPLVTLVDMAHVILLDSRPQLVRHAAERGQAPWVMGCGLGLAAACLLSLLLRGAVCYQMLAYMPRPLAEVAPSLRDPATQVSLWGRPSGHGDLLLGLPHYGPYGYGLFRAMTGIGPGGEVARPELVLEVREAASGAWRELQFPYKPGDVARRPPVVAPYQPRLDWQMWFQALSPFPEPWFEGLLMKIREGSPEVLRMLDTSSLPDADVSAVRVVAYDYKFTGYGEAAWWARAPGEGGAMVGQEVEFARPLNLAQAVARAPADWRPHMVLISAVMAGLLWGLPHGIRGALHQHSSRDRSTRDKEL